MKATKKQQREAEEIARRLFKAEIQWKAARVLLVRALPFITDPEVKEAIERFLSDHGDEP